MTEKEFGVLAKAMSSIYASDKFMATPEAVALWYRLLSDIPYEIGRLAVGSYMATEKFPPKPSDIRERAVSITSEEEKTDMEVWGIVYSGICRSTYHSQEVFDGFPKDVQLAVGSAENLKAWASMDLDSVNSVVQSQFLKTYRNVRERKNEERAIPKDVLIGIREARNKLSLAYSGEAKAMSLDWSGK